MGTEVVRYKYRLRPGALAERALIEEWHRCRFLWNEAVHQQKTGRKPNFTKLGTMLTEIRARSSWLRERSQVAQQQMLRTYAQASDASFTVKGRGRPRYKARKKALPSLEYTRRGFRIRDEQLVLPEGVTSRVGIDWGVTQTATATDEQFDLPHAEYRKRCSAELAKSQKRMARRRRGKVQAPSKGYQRARKQAAKVHKKVARQNRHDGRAWAKRVVDEHQLLAVEDFKPKFLAKSNMARKAADAAVATMKRELVERGRRAGRKVVLVRPAYTTMTCSGCFARAKQPLGLGERVFRCDTCGFSGCRDRNAARVILAVAERGHTGVDDVGHWGPPPSGGGSGAV